MCPSGSARYILSRGAAAVVRRANARRRREGVVGAGDDQERHVELLEALGVVAPLAAEAPLAGPLEHGRQLAHAAAIERQPQVLVEDVRLERIPVPAAQGDGIERAVGEAPHLAQHRPQRGDRHLQVGRAVGVHRAEHEADGAERARAAGEVVRAAERDDPRERSFERRRRGVDEEPAERVTGEEHRALAGVALHLLDRARQVLGDVLVDPARLLAAEVARAAVTAEVDVVHVVAAGGEVVGEAARRQVPGVAVLPEAVHQEHGRLASRRAARAGRRRGACARWTAAPGPGVTRISFTKRARSPRSMACSRMRLWRIISR